MTKDELDVLNRKLLGYLRASAERRPRTRRTRPFLATFDDDPNIYLNYAMPDDDADPSPADIAALIALFAERQRKPRFEYIAGAAPKVEAALLAAGFAIEDRPPVMLCTPSMPVTMPQTHGLEVFLPITQDDLAATDRMQGEAYGSPPRGVAGLRRTLRAHGLVAAARDVASGAIVAGGVATPPIDGISEIAGIGTAPAFRRRGAAGAMTALLAREAFARGWELLWLTPGGREAERIYARAGFVAVSEALHMSC